MVEIYLLNSRTIFTVFSLFQIFREVENFSKVSNTLNGIGGDIKMTGYDTEDMRSRMGGGFRRIAKAVGDDRQHVTVAKPKESDSIESDYADITITPYPEENPTPSTTAKDPAVRDEQEQIAAGQRTAACIIKQVEGSMHDWFGLRPTMDQMMSRTRKIMISFTSFWTQLGELNIVGALGHLTQLITAFGTLLPTIADLPNQMVAIMSRLVPQMTFGTMACVAGGSSDTLRQIAEFVGNQFIYG